MKISIFTIILFLTVSISKAQNTKGFPFILPKEKPNREMNAAMERNYDAYMASRLAKSPAQ